MEHIHLPETASTQDILKEKVRNSNDSLLISTDNQINGRGRQGSTWEHFDCALAFSFNITPNEVLTLTSLEIGVLLAEFFEGKAKLKWPNDLLNDRKEKVGGILCQLMDKQILVGIGLNLKGETERERFPYPVGSILSNDDVLAYNFKKELPLKIVNYILANRLTPFQVKEKFNQSCIHINSDVTITNTNEVDNGVFIGIGENGEAILQKEGQLKKVLTGSLRVKNLS